MRLYSPICVRRLVGSPEDRLSHDAAPLSHFYFSGGPGTRKGKILDNLSHVFDFELVVAEKVILEELATKVEKPEPNKITAQIRQMLQVIFVPFYAPNFEEGGSILEMNCASIYRLVF